MRRRGNRRDYRRPPRRWPQRPLTLDLSSESEFPSLSGAPQQTQSQNPGAAWVNASQRATQPNPIQRQQPQQPVTSQAPSRASQTQSHQSQPQTQSSHDDLFPSGAQFANQLDDFRSGGQGISGQLASSSQPQTGSIDEFPPLGRNATGELSQERRESLLQNTGFGSYGSTMGLSGLGQSQSVQSRNLLANSMNGQQEGGRIVSPAAGGSGGELEHFIKYLKSDTNISRDISLSLAYQPGSEWDARSRQRCNANKRPKGHFISCTNVLLGYLWAGIHDGKPTSRSP